MAKLEAERQIIIFNIIIFVLRYQYTPDDNHLLRRFKRLNLKNELDDPQVLQSNCSKHD